MKASRPSTAVASIIAVFSIASTILAGDLNPPPGTIASTNRVVLNAQAITLPYTINQPGSYVLTSNLTGVVGQNGINIDSDNVTIDLNGFSLLGVPGSLDGIGVITPAAGNTVYSGLTVLNGHLSGWGSYGIQSGIFLGKMKGLASIAVTNVRLDGLTISDCAAGGANLGFLGTGELVSNCQFINCGGNGLSCGAAVVDNCISIGNAGTGFFNTERALYTNCVADSNAGSGFLGSRSLFDNCTAIDNAGGGINAEQDSTVIDCLASFNTGFGIRVSFDTSVRRCQVARNGGDGIDTGNIGNNTRILIEDCQIVANSGWGVKLVGSGGAIFNNHLRNNGNGAINAPGYDAPLSPTSAGAGSRDNIGS